MQKRWREFLVFANRFDRGSFTDRFTFAISFSQSLGPDVETAVPPKSRSDLPRSPDALAFPETPVVNVMGAWVGLGPVALPLSLVVAALDTKTAYVVVAGAADVTFGEREVQIHAMFVPRLVVVEASPRTRWKQFITHESKR